MNHEKPIIKNKEWIGRIPSDWDFVKIKEHFVERNTKVDDISFPPLSVSMGGVVDQMENVSKSDNSENRKLVKKNDFVINSRSDRKGSSGISPRDGSVSLINIVLKPKNINSKYSEYLFKSYYFKEEFFRNGKGIHFDLWSTRYELMKQIIIPYPKIEEQNEIVEYLDNKTHQIEKLTKKIEQKIELLKEQRTSLINEVVTKGLNPNVEMKDSDVEWIGEIPKHYVSVKLRWIIDSIKDGTHGTHPSSDDGKILLSGKNVQDGFLNINDSERRIPLEEHEKIIKNGYPKEGDVLVSSVGSIGRSCVFEYPEPISFQRSVCFIRPSFKLNSYYLSYLIRSNVCQNQITTLINQSTVGGIYMGDLTNLYVITPPREEQEQIVEYLDEHTKKIDKTILVEERRIELLKEYKQSLISEVVTGKKRVV